MMIDSPQKPSFKHLILTRFNVPSKIPIFQKDQYARPVCDSAWMDHRFEIFERYCLPSMREQSCQNFEWCVFLDPLTEDRYKHRILSLQKSYPKLTPVFLNKTTIRKSAQVFAGSAPYLISTRLDSDDALHREAVALIQSRFCAQDFEFVNLEKGYRYDVEQNLLYAHEDNLGHFMSLIEKNEGEIRSVYLASHHEVNQWGRVQQVSGGRYWLETCHERTMTRRVFGGASQEKTPDLKTRLSYFWTRLWGVFRRDAVLKSFSPV